MPSLFLFCTAVSADTVILKNGRELKGLVVEEHEDRLILSTGDGEVPILRKGLKEIRYDDPAQAYLQIGQEFEKKGRLGEALAYFEKAIEKNPNLEEARSAAVRVRNRFWAAATEGPTSEIEMKQDLYDSWSQGRSVEALIKKQMTNNSQKLHGGLGVALEKKNDWVLVSFTDPKKAAALAGLRSQDRFVSIDGKSLRYLSVEAVQEQLLKPRFSNFILEFERALFLKTPKMKLKDLGLKLNMEYQGLTVVSIRKDSPAETTGFKKQDLITQIGDTATRYLPIKKAVSLIESKKDDETLVFTVRRTVLLTRR